MVNKIKSLAKNRRFQFCLAIIVSIMAIGVVGPFLTVDPYDYVAKGFQPPSSEFILGADRCGRDNFARLVLGMRNSILVGSIAGTLAVLIALVAGGLGGYTGGILDDVLNGIANIFLVIPAVPILILLSVIVGYRSFLFVAVVISITSWAGQARAIRSQVLSLKRERMVDLARLSGKSNINILFKEIFPNMLSYILILFCGGIGIAMLAESGVSLIGLGPSEGVTLGSLFHEAIVDGALLRGWWWSFIPPGLLLLTFTSTMIIASSTMDEIVNPKMVPRYE